MVPMEWPGEWLGMAQVGGVLCALPSAHVSCQCLLSDIAHGVASRPTSDLHGVVSDGQVVVLQLSLEWSREGNLTLTQVRDF